MLDIRIRTFLTVCETMSYTRAAEQLHVSQPAVSQHIRFLEDSYHVKLFVRDKKTLYLTKEGEALRRVALHTRNDEQNLRRSFQEKRGGKREIRIGATITVGEFIIPGLLSECMKKHPYSEVQVTISNTSSLIRGLREGQLHMALVEGYFDREEFDSILYETEHFAPYCGKEYVFSREIHRLDDLMGEPLIIREPGSGTREILEKSLMQVNRSLEDFQQKIQINSMYAIVHLLESNMGISFMYESAAQTGIRHGRLREIPLNDYSISHDISMIWSAGSAFSDQYREDARKILGKEQR